MKKVAALKIGEPVTLYCNTMPIRTSTLLRSVPNRVAAKKGVGYIESSFSKLIFEISLRSGVCLNYPQYATFPKDEFDIS